MIEVTDRQPLYNSRNNVLKLTIPNNITTLEALISLLKAGVYGDVFANNSTDEGTKGAAVIGTPVNKALWNSIREAAVSLVDIPDIRYEEIVPGATGWISHTFDIPFNAPPVCILNGASSGFIKVQNVTQYGLQYYAPAKDEELTAVYVDTGMNMEVV